MSIKNIEVDENIISLSDAKEYMATVLEIVEWGLHMDTIRTYQRRFGGHVDEEGVVVEYEDDETGRIMSANVHYYLRDDEHACLRFGRYNGHPDYHGSDLPFYGTAEDAADFLCGWIAERWREDQDDCFELTEEQKRDGYIPHEMSVSARKRVTESVIKAARRYAVKIAKAQRECERENAKAAAAKAKAAKAKTLKKAV